VAGSTTPITFPFISLRTIDTPDASNSGEARLFYDNSSNKITISQNGDPYVPLEPFDGASKALDNLAPTALNVDLFPGTDNDINLGSLSRRFSSVNVGPQYFNITSTAAESGTGRTWQFGIQLNPGSSQGNLRILLSSSTDAINITPSGNVGIGNTIPTSILDISGALTLRGVGTPAIAPVGQGRIYFDTTTNKIRMSENGGGYIDLGSVVPPTPTSSSSYDIYTCSALISLGDAVYLSGDSTVDLASAAISGTPGAIGIVSEKPTATSAIVISDGPVAVFSGLTVGDIYYLSTIAGEITNIPPTLSGTSLQRLGVATTPSKLYVDVNESILN
jgi:hypothetical protein